MPTAKEYAEMRVTEDGDQVFFPDDGKAYALVCCDCGLVHMAGVHCVTGRGVTLTFERDEEETEKARQGRGLSDPLYVQGYERGAKSRDTELAKLRVKVTALACERDHLLRMQKHFDAEREKLCEAESTIAKLREALRREVNRHPPHVPNDSSRALLKERRIT